MTYPQLQAAFLQTPSGLRQVRPLLQTVVWPLQEEPSQPAQAPEVGEEAGLLEAGVVGEAAVVLALGQDAPGAAYFVLILPVHSQFTGFITSFLLPFGLPWMFKKASIMMSMEEGVCKN